MTIHTGIGSIKGTATVSGKGQSRVQVIGAVAGTSVVSGIAKSIAQSIGTISGSASAIGAGTSIGGVHTGDGLVNGVNATIGAAQATAQSDGSIIGTSALLGTAQSIANSAGEADGIALIQGSGGAIANADGSISGISDVEGNSGAIIVVVSGDGFVSASSSVVGAGRAIHVGDDDGDVKISLAKRRMIEQEDEEIMTMILSILPSLNKEPKGRWSRI